MVYQMTWKVAKRVIARLAGLTTTTVTLSPVNASVGSTSEVGVVIRPLTPTTAPISTTTRTKANMLLYST